MSLRYLSALGQNSGKPVLRLISPDLIREETRDDPSVMGFNLHASEATDADDRDGLERTLRYMGRPQDGKNLILTLKTPWRDGSSKILMTPFDLLERKVALIPPQRKNQIRYHGFFAPNARLRGGLLSTAECSPDKSVSSKIHRPEFARLMARVFDIDVLQCPRCSSRMQIISFVNEPRAVRNILRSLKMSTAPPEVFMPAEYTVCYEEETELSMDDAQ